DPLNLPRRRRDSGRTPQASLLLSLSDLSWVSRWLTRSGTLRAGFLFLVARIEEVLPLLAAAARREQREEAPLLHRQIEPVDDRVVAEADGQSCERDRGHRGCAVAESSVPVSCSIQRTISLTLLPGPAARSAAR